MKALYDLIVSIVKRHVKKQSFTAKVLTVDKDKDICTVQADDGPKIYRVRLTAIEDSLTNKAVAYPKVNTYVMVSIIENNPNQAYVSKYAEIEQFKIVTNNMLINDGSMGGLANAKKIQQEYNKTKQVIDALMNACQTAINEPGNGNPSAFQALLKAAFTGLQTGDFSEIENPKVKHG